MSVRRAFPVAMAGFALLGVLAMVRIGVAEDAIPRPGPAGAVDVARVEAARARGVDFLLASQRDDGAWGSGRQTKGLNVKADIPGAHHAFTAATTALAIEALCLTMPDDPRVMAAVDKAAGWLEGFLPRLKRVNEVELYNVWAHAYALHAVAALTALPRMPEARKAAWRRLGAEQIGMLRKCEYLEGGWGYYNFGQVTARPNGMATSFTTATVLIALFEARRAGVEVPDELVTRGLAALRLQRFPDGAYGYAFGHRVVPRRGINRPAGSLARAPAGNAAFRVWTGHDEVDDQMMLDWLDRLVTRGGWLDLARKRPIPHEAVFQNSGYFYYYGQYYAAYCVSLLPEDQSSNVRAHLVNGLLNHQEKDGSWWDFPLYDYHQPYGTSYALTALARLDPAPAAEPAKP